MAAWHRTWLRKLVASLPCDTFDVRIVSLTGKVAAWRQFTPQQFVNAAGWMAAMSAKSHHMFFRPDGPLTHVLVDDITDDALHLMACDGIRPSAVVETSPDNYQAWCTLPVRNHPPEVHATACRILAERYAGDPGSAQPTQHGRVPSTRNPKPARALSDGTPPLVLLRQHRLQFNRQLMNEAQERVALEPSPAEHDTAAYCLSGHELGGDVRSLLPADLLEPLDVYDRGCHVVTMRPINTDLHAFWRRWHVEPVRKADGNVDRSATDVRRALSMLLSGVDAVLAREAVRAGSDKVARERAKHGDQRAEALVENVMQTAMRRACKVA